MLPPAGATRAQPRREGGLAGGHVEESAWAHEVHAEKDGPLGNIGAARVRGGEPEALGALRPDVQPPPGEVLVREDDVQALGGLLPGLQREDHLHVAQAHDEVHDLVDPARPSVLVPGRPDAGLAARLGRVLPAQDPAHAREEGRGVEAPEAHLRGDLHEAQEPLRREAEALLPGGGQRRAEGALAEAEALGVDVGLERLWRSIHRRRAACGDPMLHHHDPGCKIEHQLVPHGLPGGLPLCHVLQDRPDARGLRHG
mmetsp:Transcript_34499/g.107130  ORF Transcript_34499/g.107130 Transcript_34499/m.107130 type:complete len:256 (+) Transcript_34499:538-1305(+)